MTIRTDLERNINSILAQWNPIEVPDTIAETEYTDYVRRIIAIGDNHNALVTHLERVITESMGLDYDAKSPEQRTEIEEVARKLAQVLSHA